MSRIAVCPSGQLETHLVILSEELAAKSHVEPVKSRELGMCLLSDGAANAS